MPLKAWLAVAVSLSCTVLGVGVPCAGAQGVQTFTYQGRFSDRGNPANGVYDLQLKVWDTEVAGSELLTRTFNDLTVEEGLFALDVPTTDSRGDPVFDGSPRWISVGFRPGSGSGLDPFTFTARQRLSQAPEASFAERAGTSVFAEAAGLAQTADFATQAGSLTDPLWVGTPFEVAAFGDGTDEVLINTQSQIIGSSLVVNRDTTGSNLLAITTSGANGRPSVLFQTGFPGSGQSMTVQYDGAARAIRFRNTQQSIRFEVSDTRAFFSEPVEAEAFRYNQEQLRRVTVPAMMWRPQQDVSYFLMNPGLRGYSYIDTTGPSRSMFAPIQLPDGAVISSIRPYYSLGSGLDLSFSTLRYTIASTSLANLAGTDAAPGGPGSSVLLTPGGVTAVIDNATYQYVLDARSDDWASGGPVAVGPIVIEYFVSEPD